MFEYFFTNLQTNQESEQSIDTPAEVHSVFHVIDSWKCINDQRQDSLNILVLTYIRFVIGDLNVWPCY